MDFLEITYEPISMDSISNTICSSDDHFYAATDNSKADYKGEVIVTSFAHYESLAKDCLREICSAVRILHPEVKNIAIYYRVARVKGVILVVAATARKEFNLFEAIQWLIEEIKSKLPIYSTTLPSMIQINVESEEIERRVEKFLERSTDQAKERNNMSYFVNENPDKRESFCSRVDCKYEKRFYSNGYLQVNELDLVGTASPLISEDEQQDVFKRLKSAEDRLLRLEQINPRYSSYQTDNIYVDRGSYMHRKWTIDYLDQVISELKNRKVRLGGFIDNA